MEWARVESVLLHEPGREALFGLMEVDAEDLRTPLDLTAAQWDHQNYRFLLEARGINVTSLRDALTCGALDAVGEPLEGAALDRLRSLAGKALNYWFSDAVPAKRRRSLLDRRDGILQRAHPEVLADLLFLRPLVRVGFGQDPDGMEYSVRPALAAHFVRDALIATGAGAVLGRAASSGRRWENALMALALEQLGTAPVAAVSAPGCLEGGDFIPAGDFALLRVGPSTNEDAFSQLFAADALGVDEVGVVEDPDPAMVHLDDYVVFVGPDRVVVHEDRLCACSEPRIHVYAAGRDAARGPVRTLRLSEYLHGHGFSILPARPEPPHTLSGIMVLGPEDIVVAAEVGTSPIEDLIRQGVQVQVLELEAAGGRGGLRGLTQVLRRSGDGIAP